MLTFQVSRYHSWNFSDSQLCPSCLQNP
jgi:hypothetical protein